MAHPPWPICEPGGRFDAGYYVSCNTGCPTSFPHGTALGSTFNRSLWGLVGAAIAAEARGFHNQRSDHPLFFFSPADVNLARDPRWGRAQEVPGEDPLLNGEYGIALQGAFETLGGAALGGLKATVSCAKHYAAYDCENCNPCDHDTMVSHWPPADGEYYYCDRQHFNALVTDQDLVDYYLQPFRAVIESNTSSSVMCSQQKEREYVSGGCFPQEISCCSPHVRPMAPWGTRAGS